MEGRQWKPSSTQTMSEDALLKFAQPFLIGVGLMVVLNFGVFIKFIMKLNESVIRLDERVEKLQKDVNTIGKLIKGQK